MDMTSTRPYLIRAIYEWIIENRCTPYILVNANAVGVRVPRQAIKDGQVLLNVAPHAIDRLELGLEEVRFNARFSGVSQSICAPTAAVLAIYAHENGQGMMFPAEADIAADQQAEEAAQPAEAPAPLLTSVADGQQDRADQTPTAPERARPSLRIVK